MMNTAMTFLTCRKEPASLGIFSAPMYLSLCDLQLMLLYYIFTHLISDRLQYQKNVDSSQRTSYSASVSRPSSFRKAPSRTSSMKNNIAELKSLEVFAVILCIFIPWNLGCSCFAA